MKWVSRVIIAMVVGSISVSSFSLMASPPEETVHIKKLSESELMGKSFSELDLLRNHIYARHGYIFKRDDLKKHFSGLSWYKPLTSDSAAVEKKLSAIEKQNIALLKKLEGKTTQANSVAVPSAPVLKTSLYGEFIDDESNIRAEPAVKGKLLGVSKTGESFEILENKDPWILVKAEGGVTGWTHKKNVKLGTCPPARNAPHPPAAEPSKGSSGSFTNESSSRHKTSVEIDLDIDKTPEKVELEPYETTAGEDIEETFYRLKVSRRKGTEWETVWVDEKNENPFYIGHAGVETLQVVQDIDADGKVEILSACAQSDVSPTLYRLFRWDGKKFFLVKKALLTSSKEIPVEFTWTDSSEDNSNIKCWVLYFDENQTESTLTAYITSTFKDQYKGGKAVLKHSDKGFVIDRWIEPMKAQ